MTKEIKTYTYKPVEAKTRNILRRLTDLDAFRTDMQHYRSVASIVAADGYNNISAEQFANWYHHPNARLPKQPENDFKYNSPSSMLDGILEKVGKSWGTDLSPQQCAGIETLSQLFAEKFDLPKIKFADVNTHNELYVMQEVEDSKWN